MNLHRLKCFIMVVEEGSITKAAAALQMTQPPLSILIRKFEEELEVQLFKRSGKQLELTSSGLYLYEYGKELLDITENTKRRLQELDEGIRGTIKIGCITSANLFVIPNILQKMQEHTSNIVTHVREGNSAFVLNELRSLNIDIGIVRTSIRAEDLQTSTILTEQLLVALPPNHPLHEKEKISIADLKDERFLLPTTSHGLGIADDIIEACQNEGFTPNIVYWGSETLPMLLMVMKGAGICFAPACYKMIQSPNFPILKPLANTTLQSQLFVITLRDRYLSPVAKRFLTTMDETIPSLIPAQSE